MLEIFFAGDGIADVLEAFHVDKTVDFVACGEGVGCAFTVFCDTAGEIVGDADVECAGTAGEDVHEVLVVLRHGGSINEKQILRLWRRMTRSEGWGQGSWLGEVRGWARIEGWWVDY